MGPKSLAMGVIGALLLICVAEHLDGPAAWHCRFPLPFSRR